MATIERRETSAGARWKMRVFVGRDDGGRRRFVDKTFNRKGDAEKEARRLERMRDHGALVEPTKTTLNEYLNHWLKVKAGEIRARTIDDYRAIVKRYVQKPPDGAPAIGSIRLDRLRPEAFEELYTWLRDERGLAPRTIQYLHVILRQALKDAARRGNVGRNPTDYAKRPKRARDNDDVDDETTVRAMTEDEAGRLLEAARSDRYFALWLLLLTSGLRPGEAYGLGWGDVNLGDGKVHVRRSLTRRTNGHGWKLTGPKTKKARRVVPIPPAAVKALRTWKKKQAEERLLLGAEWKDNDVVFTTAFGSPLDESNLSRSNWRRIMERAALGEYGPEPVKPKGQPGPPKKRPFRPAFRIYDCRHTHATLALLKGENIKVVSERLGHASIVMTADIYSHVLPDMQAGVVEKMETIFGAFSG